MVGQTTDYDPLGAWWMSGTPGSRPHGGVMTQLQHGSLCKVNQFYHRFTYGSPVEVDGAGGRFIRVHGDDLDQVLAHVEFYEVIDLQSWTCFRLPIRAVMGQTMPAQGPRDVWFPIEMWMVVLRDGTVAQGGTVMEQLAGPPPERIEIHGATRQGGGATTAHVVRLARREPDGALRVVLLHDKTWTEDVVQEACRDVQEQLALAAPNTTIRLHSAREAWVAHCQSKGVHPDQAPGWVWRDYESRLPYSVGLCVVVPEGEHRVVPQATGRILRLALGSAHPLALVGHALVPVQAVEKVQKQWEVTL